MIPEYQKKAEKITQAIYLISNHVKDNDPLKWELRKEAISFSGCARTLGESGGVGGVTTSVRDMSEEIALDSLSLSAKDLISLLTLSSVAGLISSKNINIIIGEIESLLKTFEISIEEYISKAGFVLSEEFFATDPDMKQQISKGQNINFLLSNKQISANSSKNNTLDTPKSTQNSIENKGKDKNSNINSIKDKKDDRVNRIMTLLKNQKDLTIKDFVSVISDCSEKTIQRELIELVEKGVIRRDGERRWSRYSLK